MSKLRATAGLAARNSRQAWGRVLILVLLLSAALVARSAVYLVQSGLCNQAVEGVSGADQTTLPRDFNAIVLSTDTAYTPEMIHAYIWHGLSFMPWERPSYLTGNCTRYLGSGGEIWVVRPWARISVTYVRLRGPQPLGQEEWYVSLDGTFPEEPGEVAIPATFAQAYGVGVGDTVSLVEKGQVSDPSTFTVSAVYQPAGKGPFFEYFLSVNDSETQTLMDWLSLRLTGRDAGLVRAFGGDPAAGYTGTIVHEFLEPAERMRVLAQAVYGAQSAAANTGILLVGVAVLVVLLVAMVERRREAAIYKMVGMNSQVTLSVLTLELIVALVIALAVAAPVYWLLASRFILDVYGTSLSMLITPFLVSAAWMVVVAVLGAGYPFALVSIGTPNQLLTCQRIYLFRRKQVLRGWTDIDTQ